MRHLRTATLALCCALAASACSKSRPVSGAAPGGGLTIPGGGPGGGDVSVSVADCTKCHGDAARAALATDAAGIEIAPPRDASGATTGARVGAHLAHLRPTRWRAGGVPCASCHVVPATASTHVQPGVQLRGLAATAWTGAPAIAPQYLAPGCSATYCHGNFPGGLDKAMLWTGASSTADCGSCHGIPPSFQTDGVTAHTTSTSCGACHTGYTSTSVNPATHIDGVVQAAGGHPAGWVDVNLANRGGPHAVAYSEGGAQGCTPCHGATLAGGAVAPACTVCHDGGSHAVPLAGGTTVGPIVAFEPGGAANCVACHGTAGGGNDAAGASTSPRPPRSTVRTAPRPDSGSHAKHVTAGVASAMAPATTLTCNQCHAAPGSWYHASGAVDFAFGPIATNAGAVTPIFTQSSNSCAAAYCHGNFRNGSTGNAPVWGAAGSATCGTCHGLPPGGSHPALGNATCGTCHAGYTASSVAAATHVDGKIDVKGSTCTFAAGCTVTDCTACHGNPPATTAGLSGAVFYHPQNDDCAACHGAGYSKTGPTTGTVAAATHQNGTVNLAAPLSCTSCHGTAGRANTAALGTFDASQAAAPPKDTTGALTGGTRIGAHLAHVNPAAAGQVYPPLACPECHSGAVPAAGSNLHSSGTVTVAFAGRALSNGAAPSYASGNCNAAYCHGGTLPAYAKGTFAGGWTWTATGASCGSCHGYPPAAPHTASTACSGCHPGTVNADNVTINVAGGLHIDGAVEFAEPTAGGAACTTCHAGVVTMMTSAANKHSLIGWTDTATDSGVDWSAQAQLSAVPPASRSCVNMCHGDHPHDLTAGSTHEYNLYADPSTAATRANGTASRTTANRARTDFDATANIGMCASCHQKPILTAGGTGITVTAATYGASAHDFNANAVGATTYTWSYQLHDGGLFQRNCTKCHASRTEGTTPSSPANASATVAVHGSADASLLAGTINNPAGNPDPFVCYNCHGSTATPAAGAQGNRSGKDVQAQIAKLGAGGSGHPANADTAHSTAAETAAAFGNQLGGLARHASCLDCHDPHEAKAGTHAVTTNLAGPPLQGAWGAQLSTNPAFWTAPAAGNFTKKTIVAGTDLEATLCFKCHSSFYGALPASPSSSPSFTETDTAREFNPANAGTWATTGTANAWSAGETAGGFHPVLATAGGNLGAINMANLVTTNFAWRTTGARNTMTCTDCHESDVATDPNGPHGSAAKFILKGPNTTWSNAVTIASASPNMPNGTFCANCHSQTFASSRGPMHTNGRHTGVACMNCHAAIPHGGPRIGMLNPAAGTNTTNLPAITTWDGVAPYWQGTASNRLYLASYPATSTTSWSQGNCGCNGSGH